MTAALRIQTNLYVNHNSDFGMINLSLGRLELDRNHLQEAIMYATIGVDTYSLVLPPGHRGFVDSWGIMARIYSSADRNEESNELFERAINLAKTTHTTNHWVTTALQVNRARALAGLGRFAEAEETALAGYERLRSMFPAKDSRVVGALECIRDVYRREEEFGRTNPPPVGTPVGTPVSTQK